jgi:DNA-binding CsgD family transcriptional regulator
MQHLWPPLCGLAELAWLEDRPEDIPPLLAWAYDEAMQSDSRWARGEVGFWMWQAGAIHGPPEGAADPFALHMSGEWYAAAAAWRALGCPYEEGLALCEGDLGARLQALEIFDRLGAGPMSVRLRTRLREEGHTGIPRGPRPATKANPLGLTSRQAEVLALIGEGMTNSEIAEKLFISQKTAEHHVSAIYTRLGISNRAEAITRALALTAQDRGGSASG